MNRLSRREFLERALAVSAAGAGMSMAPGVALGAGVGRGPRSRRSPNEVIRIAVCGVRGQGRGHVGAYKSMPDVEVAAICDADSGVIDAAMKAVPGAKYYQDIRRLLDDDSIDAISIAMPNHWHSLATIWGLRAGKHVYVEKPVSHDVFEGRKVIEAAARSGKVVQHGTQARTAPATRQAIEYLRSGALGKVLLARALCYKRRDSIGKVDGPQQPPATCDYSLWSGPAEMRPLRRKSLHYDWHWDFLTGNGDLGNQGIHQMDIARWGLGVDALPERVMSVGGRVGYEDDGNTPNTQICLYDYGEQQLIFEVRGLKTDPYRGADIGVVFHCEKGYLVSASYTKVHAYDHEGNVVATFTGDASHFEQFIAAVRAGDPAAVNASPLDAHRSSALCHLGNISYRVGEKQALAGLEDAFAAFRNGAGVEAGAEAMHRFTTHLRDNGLNLAKTPGVCGPVLRFDPLGERFSGDHADAANALLRKPPREGFAVPDSI